MRNMFFAALAALSMLVAAPAAAQTLTVTYNGTVLGTSGGSPFAAVANFTGTANDTTNNTFPFTDFTAMIANENLTISNATGQLTGDMFNVFTGATLFTSFNFLPSDVGNVRADTPFAVTLGQGGTFNASGDRRNLQITGGAGIFSFTRVTAAVPEASTWAMMLVGFGGMGMALRRNRRKTAIAQLV